MKDRISSIRPLPEKIVLSHRIIFTVFVALLGLILGYVAKATDSSSIIGDIGTNLGVWIFVGTLVVTFSFTPFAAALNLPVFLLSMLAAYYVYGSLVLGFFPEAYFIGWLILSLISPIGGFIIWFSRGKGWPAIISAALPTAILLAEGYPAFYTFQIPFIFDLLFAAILLIMLPKTLKQKITVFIVSCVFAFIIVQFNFLQYLPW